MTIPERNRLPHPESATAWFGDRFGVPLPRGLRERAEAMSWDAFVATYGRSGGRCGWAPGSAPTPIAPQRDWGLGPATIGP